MEGVEFQWNIGSIGSSPSNYGNQVLRFISFIDSPYETPPSVAKFDAVGLRGHMVLIEGVKTGSAKVIDFLNKQTLKNNECLHLIWA